MIGWIDSHAHIVSDPLYARFDEIKAEAHQHDVQKICIICGSLEEIERAFLKTEHDAMFDLAIGVHPSNVQDISDTEFRKMMTYLDSPKVKFLGEIGLDYYWDTTYAELQRQRFVEQIAYANQYQLPIAVHMRESTADVLRTLQEHPVDRTGIIHCYTDSVENALLFEQMGYYLGVGGVFTFKNGANVREVVDAVDINRIITETDSPYLTPVPFRGKENRPAMVSYVGEALAKHTEISVEALQTLLWNTYNNIIGEKK